MAQYLKVAPWELENVPLEWRERALTAMEVEAEVFPVLRKRAEEEARMRAAMGF